MDDLFAIRSSLDQVNYYLQRSSSSKMETGVLPDSPVFEQETRMLEQIQSELSLAIKKLQRHRNSNDPESFKIHIYAMNLKREMREAIERVNKVNLHELLAAASEKIHEYHETIERPTEFRELTETPQYYGFSRAGVSPSIAGGLEASVALFSIISAYVQLRRRRKR
jgi:hypothetical protein